MEHFIETVRNYPCLWNTTIEQYKNIELKDAAWRKVKEDCDLPDIKEAKNMWKKLRDGYRQALGKKKCGTGQAATSKNPWKYEKIMEFILPYLTNRPRSTNAVILDHSSNNSQDESELLIDSLPQEFENDATEGTQNINISISEEQSPPVYSERKRKNSDPIVQFLHDESKRRERRDALTRNVLVQYQQNDSVQLKSFFDTMYETSKVLPENTQLKIQRQIFNIVMDAREKHSREQLPNCSTSTSKYYHFE